MEQVIWLTIKSALLATFIGLPFFIAIAYLLSYHVFRGKRLIEALILLPMALPPVVTGLLLLYLFSRTSPIGSVLFNRFGVEIPFSFSAVVITGIVVSAPIAIKTIKTGFLLINPFNAAVAQSLGKKRLAAVMTTIIPLNRDGYIVAACLTFVRCIGEFGATMMFAGNIDGRTRTLSLAIFSAFNRPEGESEVWILIALSLILSYAVIFLSLHWEGKHRA